MPISDTPPQMKLECGLTEKTCSFKEHVEGKIFKACFDNDHEGLLAFNQSI